MGDCANGVLRRCDVDACRRDGVYSAVASTEIGLAVGDSGRSGLRGDFVPRRECRIHLALGACDIRERYFNFSRFHAVADTKTNQGTWHYSDGERAASCGPASFGSAVLVGATVLLAPNGIWLAIAGSPRYRHGRSDSG